MPTHPLDVGVPLLDSLAVRPWPDPVIDQVGHDPRSAYVEQFWLGILGPSTTWLIRRLVAGLEASPAGYDLHLGHTAAALGLANQQGRNSPFMRSLARCCQFGMARLDGESTLEVRRKLPPLTRRQVERLPEPLRAAHEAWQARELATPPAEALRRRARRLALSLVELGEDLEATERQLTRWRFSPPLAREAAAWAWDRHRRAAAGEAPAP